MAFGLSAIALLIGASIIIQSGVKQIKKAINKHFGELDDAVQKRKDNLLDSVAGPENPIGVAPYMIDSKQPYKKNEAITCDCGKVYDLPTGRNLSINCVCGVTYNF